jgi:hypothetical protein
VPVAAHGALAVRAARITQGRSGARGQGGCGGGGPTGAGRAGELPAMPAACGWRFRAREVEERLRYVSWAIVGC